MSIIKFRSTTLPAILLTWNLATCASAQVNVTTQAYDNYRTGANLSETQLSKTNVNVNSFGKIWTYSVSGSVFAQPLYLSGVNMPGRGSTNVVYIFTMNDMVYAFNADSPAQTPLWSVDLTKQVAGSTPVPIVDIVGHNDGEIVGNVGIEGTPVIDPGLDSIFLVARTKEGGQYIQRLYTLNTKTGAVMNSQVLAMSVPGTGAGNVNGIISFDPLIQQQQAGLAYDYYSLSIAWGSHEGVGNYHGWVNGFCTTPGGSGGGVSMSGRAPVFDSGNHLYYATGRGTWDGVTNFSQSFLKSNGADGWFTPSNYATLNANGQDLGSSGLMGIPGAYQFFGGGPNSTLYLLRNSTLGGETATNSQVVQTLNVGGGTIESGAVLWNRTGNGPWMYVWADQDYLKAFSYKSNNTFGTSPVSEGAIRAPNGNSGGVLTLSANGSMAGSGIVWASMPATGDGKKGVQAGVLRAFNADDLTTELWDSNQNATRDGSGNWPKFSEPLVVNGRVYVGGYPSDGVGKTLVSVYGLLQGTFMLSAAAPALTLTQGVASGDVISVVPQGGFNGTVTLAVSGVPAGVDAAFGSNPISGTSTLTVKASSTAKAGQYTLTVTGNAEGHTATTTVTITIPGSFTLSPGTPTLSLAPGAKGTDVITVGDYNGFSGKVMLAVSGVPAGVDSWFGTNPTDGTSTLTVKTYNPAPAGTYTLTITGTSGTMTATTTVTLSISAVGTFDISLSSSTVSTGNNSEGTVIVTVIDHGGFNGYPAISVTGLDNQHYYFTANNPDGTISLTIVFSPTGRGGCSGNAGPLTVVGTFGNVTATAPTTLTVTC